MKREGILDLFLGRKVLMEVFQYLEENRGNVITKRETQRGRIGHYFFRLVIFPLPHLPTLISKA